MELSERPLTGIERSFRSDEIIVSKTDPGGRITYANPIFLRLAGLTEREALGAPHNVVRHPDMPSCIFRLLWQTIQSKKELFAFVNNRSSNGDHYWVFAHVTPTFDSAGQVTGYHSTRRRPDPRLIAQTIAPLYSELLAEEKKQTSKAKAIAAGTDKLTSLLADQGTDYERFIFSLQE